jgi:hypothetical protein
LLLVEWTTLTLFGAEGLAGLIGLAAGSSLLRSYRMVGAPGLRRLGFGLLLLGLSQVAALSLELLVFAQGATIPREGFDLFDAAFWLHYAFLLTGLGYVFRSFGRHPFRWMPVMAPLLLRAGPILELLAIIVLFFIVLHAGLNHIARKGTGSIRVAIGFFLLFTAHTLNLIGYTALTPRWWLAEIVNLGGFAILFFAVKRPRVRSDG